MENTMNPTVSAAAEPCKIIREPVEFLALEDEWRSLFDRVPSAYLAQSFDWCRLGWETVAALRGRRLFVLVLREEERVVLIWPLVEAKYGPCCVLQPLGSEASEYLNLLVEDGPETTRRVTAAWETLQQTRGIDMLNLIHVRCDTVLYGLLAQDSRCRVLERNPWLWVRAPDETKWEGYWRSRSRNFRRGLSRGRRRLADSGKVVFEIVDCPDHFAELLDWVLTRKRVWMESQRLRNKWLFTGSYREFLRLAVGQIRRPGRLAVLLLSLDGAPVAALISCIDRWRVEALIAAFDIDYATVSPGQILEADGVQWALDRGLEFDFRLGAEPYKESWANERGLLATFARPLTTKGTVLVQVLLAYPHLRSLALRVPLPIRIWLKTALKNLDQILKSRRR